MATNLNIKTFEAVSTLRYAVGAANTVIECQVADAGLFPSSGAFYVVLASDDSARREICLVTSRSTQALTVTRGSLGTTAAAHPAGEKLELIPALAISNKGYDIGSSASPEAYTAGTPIVSIYTTNADTGTTNAEPFYVKSVLTGANGYGGRAKFHAYKNVTGGTNFMGLKSLTEFGVNGRTAGLASGFCSELVMPNANLGSGGVYAGIEIEYVAGGTSLVSAGSLAGNYATMMYLNNSGDADGDFDANGFFMSVQGLTAGANKVLSATSETLKVGIGTSTRYLVLSQAQDGLALGNSGAAQSYTAGTPPLNFYFTGAGSGTTNVEPFVLNSTVTGTSPVGGRAKYVTNCNVTAGGWLNALKSHMVFGTSGKVTGLASSMVAEMDLPNANLGAGGAYYPLEIELNPGASTVSAGSPTGNQLGMIYMSVNTNLADFNTNGFLFRLVGPTNEDGGVFYSGAAPNTLAASLRVIIGTTVYYLPLYSAQHA